MQPSAKKRQKLRGNRYLCPVELLTKPLSYQQFCQCLSKIVGALNDYLLFRTEKIGLIWEKLLL